MRCRWKASGSQKWRSSVRQFQVWKYVTSTRCFSVSAQVIRAFRKFETKITFFPKKTSIIAIQSLKNVDCAILEKFVLFKGKNQRILVAVFFKRIISVNLEENLKNKISDFRLSNIIRFCYCILFFHFLDQYVCMDVNFVWIISSFL